MTDTLVKAGQVYCYTIQPYNLGPTLFNQSEPRCGTLPIDTSANTLYLPIVVKK